jgi:hypothetical protein
MRSRQRVKVAWVRLELGLWEEFPVVPSLAFNIIYMLCSLLAEQPSKGI